MQNLPIFPVFYLPPICYFAELKTFQYQGILECHEHFPKQTFRNRASIASPDGILDLIVPVVKGSKGHTAVKDVKISYDLRWQRLHWLSFQNCYRSSAYFEFYEDELASFYEKKFEFLLDLNLELYQWIFKKLKIDFSPQFTDEYQKTPDKNPDFRNNFLKKEVHLMDAKPYFQVFSDRNPFIPNLSIIDLLFNQGPQAKLYF